MNRFNSNLKKATAKINSLKNEYNKLNISDKEKIDKLKKQYYEHRVLWETVINTNLMNIVLTDLTGLF